jgi:hypothetical protein
MLQKTLILIFSAVGIPDLNFNFYSIPQSWYFVIWGWCTNQIFCFRSGFVVLDLEDVPAGTYNIVPSTFMPNQEGPFILTVKASCPFSVARLQWCSY